MLALDLSKMSTLNFLTGTIYNIINRGFPFRFGVVPLVESEEGRCLLFSSGLLLTNDWAGGRMAKLVYHLFKNYGPEETMRFLQMVCMSFVHFSLIISLFSQVLSSSFAPPAAIGDN